MFWVVLAVLPIAAAERPHIVFILADDLGHSDMGWQGSPIRTPNLDALRAAGMYLERNYVQPQCSPTRAAFLSGNYPYRYGLHEHIVLSYSLGGLPGEVKTVAEKLQEAGYRTAVVGKWHVGGHLQSQLPHRQGFEHSFVCLNGAISYWNYRHDGRPDIVRNGERYFSPSPADGEASGNPYVTDLWAQEAAAVIGRHDPRNPLFLYLAFTAPHHPQQVPDRILAEYPEDQLEPLWLETVPETKRTPRTRRHYMAMVDAMDRAIGEVLAALERRGMRENTLIVFTSDNGGIPEADNRPLRSRKGDSFEGGVRVPALAVWPGRIRPGSRSAELVYVADWYATFAELAGLTTDGEEKDSISARDILQGRPGRRRDVPIISAGRHALITPRWSLVGGGVDYPALLARDLADFSLFDLDADVAQSRPTDRAPNVARELRRTLADHFRRTHHGTFNWDIRHSRYRGQQYPPGHSLDSVANDEPALTVRERDGRIEATIAPVHPDLRYRLQGSADGATWTDLAEHAARSQAPEFVFPPVVPPSAVNHFRVQAELRFGLPARDGFSADDGYRLGPLRQTGTAIRAEPLFPAMEGFLPTGDLIGGEGVRLVDANLDYAGWPAGKGALELTHAPDRAETTVSRYFVAPHSRGRVFASLLLQFRGDDPAGRGEINWLRQSGSAREDLRALSVALHRDGIRLPADGAAAPATVRYDGAVACVVFEFEHGPIGGDTVRVYVNPARDGAPAVPAATLHGEFTFDRLQFRLTGGATQLRIDELRVGPRWTDVVPAMPR